MHIQNVLVIGLGRIGLPQALSLANSGVSVYGFDDNAETVDALKEGKTPFYEPSMDSYLANTQDRTFFLRSAWSTLAADLPNIDAIIFTVGTKPATNDELHHDVPFDLSAYFLLLSKLFTSKPPLKSGVKLIIRTTLPLGTTDLLKTHIEETYSLKEGQDFFLAFVPERITEGRAIAEFISLPKIIGVYTEAAFQPISDLFNQLGGEVLRVRNPITAEFCKLTDNSFRSTMFAFANEIAMLSSRLDVNIEEVIAVVNTDYDRNHIPNPGFVSGYCLGKDPYIFELDFMKHAGRDFHSLWYYGRKTNDYLVDFIVNKTLAHLKNRPNPRVTLLGLAFKEDVDDFRMSHAFLVMNQLIAGQVNSFQVYDPNLSNNRYTTFAPFYSPYISLASNTLTPELFTDTDAIIICVRHQELVAANNLEQLNLLLKNTHIPCYLYDGWDIWQNASTINSIEYEGIGFKQHTEKS